MANRNDITIPEDTINRLSSKRNKNDSQALYGDNISPDANAKAGVGDNPNVAKKGTKLAPLPKTDGNSKGRIGKDPTESF